MKCYVVKRLDTHKPCENEATHTIVVAGESKPVCDRCGATVTELMAILAAILAVDS